MTLASLRRMIARLRNLLRNRPAEEELSREIASHLALLEDEFRRQGMAPDEAHRRQYAAGSRRNPAKGDQRSTGARSEPRPRDSAIANREYFAVAASRAPGSAVFS
jgi:hypothetical protein